MDGNDAGACSVAVMAAPNYHAPFFLMGSGAAVPRLSNCG
jgi:hypothetical protein